MVNLVPYRAKKIKHKSRVSEEILLYCKSGFQNLCTVEPLRMVASLIMVVDRSSKWKNSEKNLRVTSINQLDN